MATYKGEDVDVIGDDTRGRLYLLRQSGEGGELCISPDDPDFEPDPKPETTPEQDIAKAIRKLRKARNLLVKAGARRTADRVRKALTSAGGALRHAEGKALRPFKVTIEGREHGFQTFEAAERFASRHFKRTGVVAGIYNRNGSEAWPSSRA